MKKLFTSIVSVMLFATTYAQDIKYHDVSPDTTISTWEVFGVHGLDIWWHPTPEVVVNTWSPYEVLAGTDSMPQALNKGAVISSSSSGIWAQLSYQCLNCDGVTGNWKGVTDKYLGFRKRDSTNHYLYGWVRLDVSAAPASFTVKEYAMSTLQDVAINAGQMFSTGISNTVLKQIRLVNNNRMISVDGIRDAEVMVADMSGKTLHKRVLHDNDAIDMSSVPVGVYVFYIRTDNIYMVIKQALD